MYIPPHPLSVWDLEDDGCSVSAVVVEGCMTSVKHWQINISQIKI